MITTSFGMSNVQYQQQRQAEIRQRYNDIYAHERKHKNAAGKYGGSIVIEKDANGVPTGGHVNVQMPVLDKQNPQNTIKHADIIIKSAMAPDDPSKQDYKVAAEARGIKAQAKAQQFQNNSQVGSRLNFYA